MSVELPPQAEEARGSASAGLEFIAWLRWAAETLDEDQRGILSYAASALANRGWLSPLPKFTETSTDALGLSAERVQAAVDHLIKCGLLGVDGERITHIAATISTSRTSITYISEDDGVEPVHLTGPIAVLGIAKGLGRPGKIVATCTGGDGRVTLLCDESGIHSREPETVAMFLPAWPEGATPIAVASEGGLFADDDALAAWQTDRGEPDGLPLSALFLPLALTDLGEQLGVALESMLDRVANFA